MRANRLGNALYVVVLGPLEAAEALVFSRRRVHGQMTG